MNRRRFLLSGTGLLTAALTGCMGSKGDTTVVLTPQTASQLELVDWGKSGNTLRVKLKNKSDKKVPGANEALFIRWYDKQGQYLGMPDRIANFHLPPGESNKYEIDHNDIDKVGKVEIGIADARRGL
jgi:hypothetical protein